MKTVPHWLRLIYDHKSLFKVINVRIRFMVTFLFMSNSQNGRSAPIFLVSLDRDKVRLCSPWSRPRTIWDFEGVFLSLMSILIYVVLGAGRAQFRIFKGIFDVYFILCSPRSGPCTIWEFRRGFLVSILLYVVLGAGRPQFGILPKFPS